MYRYLKFTSEYFRCVGSNEEIFQQLRICKPGRWLATQGFTALFVLIFNLFGIFYNGSLKRNKWYKE